MKSSIQRLLFLASALASGSFESLTQAQITDPLVSPTSVETPMPSPFPSTGSPTEAPAPVKSYQPTEVPTKGPTEIPTAGPTLEPTRVPTTEPTMDLTGSPSTVPSSAATGMPTSIPTESHSLHPTENPTETQSNEPSTSPTAEPTFMPTAEPTAYPTSEPTKSPEMQPSNSPSSSPSTFPSESDITRKVEFNTTTHFEAPFQNFYSGLTSTPTSDSLAPTSPPSDEPSVKPTAVPTSITSTEPSASPSQLFSDSPTSSKNTETSTNPPSQTLVNDSSGKPTGAPVSEISSAPTWMPSAEPTSDPLSTTTVADESEEEEISNPPTEPQNRETSPPFSDSRTDSTEHEALVSMRLEGIPELLDPASGLLLATSITHFLSDEIIQIDGVPVFFLKTEIYTQNQLADSKNRDVVLVEAGVHGIAVGGTVTDKVFTAKVEQVLNEKKEDLENHVRGALESFSGRLAGSNTDDKNVLSAVGGNSTSNTVLLVAIIASVMIGMLILSIVCIAFARREKDDHHDMVLKKSGTGLTVINPSRTITLSSTSKSLSIKNSKSLPRPYDVESHSSSKGSSRCRSVPNEQAPHSHHLVGSQAKSHSSTTPSQSRSVPLRPPITTTASYKSRSGLSVLAMSSCESLSPSSSAGMFGYQSQCGDNIELVGIEDDEGTWAGTKVAAITGKAEVQKAEMLCEHVHGKKATLNRQVRSSTADSVIGSTTVLNDLVLSETTSKHHDTMGVKTPKTRGGLLAINLWKKNKGETAKANTSEAGLSMKEVGDQDSNIEGYVPRNRSSESVRSKKQENFSRNRSGERIGSFHPVSAGQRTRSSMSHLMDAYSFSTAGSRSTESKSTHSSVHSARKGSPGQHDAKPMKRRQSSGISENDYPRSRTRSSQQSRMSSGSSALSASLASGYSSDSCDSESSYSQSSQEVPDESFLLRLKETVSTAAFSLATTDQRPESSSEPYAHKLNMSSGSGPSNGSSNPVAAILGFASP